MFKHTNIFITNQPFFRLINGHKNWTHLNLNLWHQFTEEVSPNLPSVFYRRDRQDFSFQRRKFDRPSLRTKRFFFITLDGQLMSRPWVT